MEQIIKNSGNINNQVNIDEINGNIDMNDFLISKDIKILRSNNEFKVSKISENIETTLPTTGSNQDAGYDIYVPNFTQELIDKFLEVNKDSYISSDNHNFIEFRKADDYNTRLLMFDKIDKVYHIFSGVMLPTGLQFLFPANLYGEIVNRSSNSKFNINVITGYIDNSHSNNCCLQISQLSQNISIPNFRVGDRIGQLILRQLIKVNLNYSSTEDFDNNEFVISNRNIRKGNGIGSTGK